MGNFINYLTWGGNPDTPNSFSGMSLRDIYHVQSTWAPVYAKCATYGLEMFLRLFRKDAETKSFFKAIRNLDEEKITNSYQFKAHVRNLMGSINQAVENLQEPEVVAALMNKLGESHHGRRIKKLHFEEFREIWIHMLEVDLKVGDQVLASWIKFIDFIYNHIFDKLCVDGT